VNHRATILILDDEEHIIQSLGKTLQELGYAVIVCLHPREAFDRMSKSEIDLVISDLNMPAMNGIDFLMQTRNKCPNAARALLVNPEERKIAGEAISRGIADWFIDKPWDEPLVKISVPLILKFQRMARANRILEEMVKKQREKSDERLSM
jgi:DNA-binding NtrC family response regulator